MITVAIPVGPEVHHQAYLEEALVSVKAQTTPPANVLLVSDMAQLDLLHTRDVLAPIPLRVYYTKWRVGVATAFNFCVACASTELVIMLGADDTLEPDAVLAAEEACRAAKRPSDTYWYYGVRYMHEEYEDQYLPCNAAMVSKELWRRTGGFAPESAVGAPDCAYVSQFITHERSGLVDFVCIDGSRPLYNYRIHEQTDTAGRADWQGIIHDTRDLLTRNWQPPQWGRYV